MPMKVVETQRKGRILNRPQFACLRSACSLNVTRGCGFLCVYCYARGYPEAPPPGEVHLYKNLPEKLARELDNPRRRSRISWVAFNTASDCFQPHPDVLDVTYEAMKTILDRGIGISFLTKGCVPDRFIDLFSSSPHLVLPRIGLVSVDPAYQELFEPHAASPSERLENLDRLLGKGIHAEVRVDPIIPFLTDDESSVRKLCRAVFDRGVVELSISYLHLRPAILEQLRGELPRTEFELLRSCFGAGHWTEVGSSSRSKLIPRSIRERGYGRFREIAGGFGISARVCSCKNPDMPGELCGWGHPVQEIGKEPSTGGTQLDLFRC